MKALSTDYKGKSYCYCTGSLEALGSCEALGRAGLILCHWHLQQSLCMKATVKLVHADYWGG